MTFLRIQLEALQERRRVAKEEGGSMGATGAHDEQGFRPPDVGGEVLEHFEALWRFDQPSVYVDEVDRC